MSYSLVWVSRSITNNNELYTENQYGGIGLHEPYKGKQPTWSNLVSVIPITNRVLHLSPFMWGKCSGSCMPHVLLMAALSPVPSGRECTSTISWILLSGHFRRGCWSRPTGKSLGAGRPKRSIWQGEGQNNNRCIISHSVH